MRLLISKSRSCAVHTRRTCAPYARHTRERPAANKLQRLSCGQCTAGNRAYAQVSHTQSNKTLTSICDLYLVHDSKWLQVCSNAKHLNGDFGRARGNSRKPQDHRKQTAARGGEAAIGLPRVRPGYRRARVRLCWPRACMPRSNVMITLFLPPPLAFCFIQSAFLHANRTNSSFTFERQ